MGKPITTHALTGPDIISAGQDLIVGLAEGNAAATRILEDVFRIAEHEKEYYVCSTTKDPTDLLKVLQDERITGAKLCDVYLHLCESSAAHLAAVLTVAAHPHHFSHQDHDSARYYLGLCDTGAVTPTPIHEFHCGVVMQLRATTGQADIHSRHHH